MKRSGCARRAKPCWANLAGRMPVPTPPCSKNRGACMLIPSKCGKGLYEESDPACAAKFSEASFGTKDGSRLLLHPLEAAYLVKIGKAAYQKPPKRSREFDFASAVYSQIRATGRVVRPYLKSKGYLRVYAPGVGRESERPSLLVYLAPGKAPSPNTIASQVRVAHSARLDLVIACGTEKEIRYYKISSYSF